MTGTNNTILEPKGSDFVIQRLQNRLFKDLDWEDIQMFGRASKIPYPEEKTRFSPQVCKSNGEYIDPLLSDSNNGNVFFVLGDRATTTEGFLYKIECKIIFMLNLKKVYSTYVGRADEKAHEDVVSVLKGQQNIAITSIGTGLKECLGEFDTENIKFTDVHPNHIFCITGQLSYSVTC